MTMHDSFKVGVFSRLLTNGSFLAIIIFMVIFIIYALSQGSYVLSVYGITTLLNGSIVIAIAAAAETFILISGGFDLSVAGIVVLTNTIIAVSGGSLGYGGSFDSEMLDGAYGAIVCLAIALGVGAFVGFINGFLVAKLKLQAIAATLGTSIVCSGCALLILPQPGGNVPESVVSGFTGNVGPIPIALIIMIIVGLICWFILQRTNFGVNLLAIGKDRTAAELSGISLVRVEWTAFVIAGILSGFSGFMLSAQTGTGSPQLSNTFILLTFAAAAIGGTSFEGGKGSAIASMIGACILAVLQKMLFAIGVSTFYTGIFQGFIMLCAMMLCFSMTKFERKLYL